MNTNDNNWFNFHGEGREFALDTAHGQFKIVRQSRTDYAVVAPRALVAWAHALVITDLAGCKAQVAHLLGKLAADETAPKATGWTRFNG